VTLPTYQGKAINFRHLAAHSSSLPNMPDNLEEAILNPDDPFASYSKFDLYNFLDRYSLRYPIGSRGEYSNIGVGLLGHVLGRINHTTYENLVKQRLLNVLAMDNTSLFLTGKQQTNLAYGHSPEGVVTANWNLNDCLQGSGAIKSSLNDMLKYLEANMGLIDTPLKHAMEFAHQPVIKTIWGDYNALGWGIETLPNGEKMVWHNGGTAGYRAFIGFIQRLKLGVIVLSNFRDTDMDAIGRNVLRIVHPGAEETQ
jgi:CubicO group peptidase (beta-lactamase class C family)